MPARSIPVVQKLGHDVCEEASELLVHICAGQAGVQHARGAIARAAMRRLPGLHEMIQAVAQDVQECLACRIEHLRQPGLTLVKSLSSRTPDPSYLQLMTIADHSTWRDLDI